MEHRGGGRRRPFSEWGRRFGIFVGTCQPVMCALRTPWYHNNTHTVCIYRYIMIYHLYYITTYYNIYIIYSIILLYITDIWPLLTSEHPSQFTISWTTLDPAAFRQHRIHGQWSNSMGCTATASWQSWTAKAEWPQHKSPAGVCFLWLREVFLETPGGWNGRVGSQMAMKRCSGHWNSWPEPAPWKVLARWAPSIQVPLTVSPRFRLLRISRDFSQQNVGNSPKLGISLTRNWIQTELRM